MGSAAPDPAYPGTQIQCPKRNIPVFNHGRDPHYSRCPLTIRACITPEESESWTWGGPRERERPLQVSETRCQDYIHALEEERRKIQVFQRELPLCLELVTQAIEACKQQLSGTSSEYNLHGQSECSEQTSSDVPVFEEFIPIKRASSQSDGEEQESSKKPKNDSDISNKDGKNCNDKNSKKSDWLRSVQLWNQTSDPPPKEVKRNGSGGAFHPFKKERSVATTAPSQGPAVNKSVPPASTSSTADTGGNSGGGNKKEEKEGQSQRKARRCYTKQIRELMKVDGLTNDEVKSHLQKYRLHTRRPSPSIPNTTATKQPPQFVVVGGLWVPPEYASMATTATSGEACASGVATSNVGIYAPVASLPPPFQESSASPKQRLNSKPMHSEDQGSHSEGRGQSHSPATSSSTRTTTASPAY
ncbi:UNVERIFIED_CONTAM: Transcription factor HHO3 [Sesamum calycinum]|uniref:Transcription factor HHO3 n=1 Tax=Sesamum calycinum TaxID=2727403 RepID=A0AAW2QX81_9LAMI